MSKTVNQIKAYARKKSLPIIPIQAKDVSFISEPNLFYDSILSYIKSSQQRLALSALYLGTGPKEKALVEAICDNIRQNNQLNVNLILDAHRASRLDDKGNSSITLLHKALDFDNVELNLIETRPKDTLLSGVLNNIQRWNEISSTYHSKILVSDDDVLITGANLSAAYFEQRQDRYMHIKGSKILSDYLFNLLGRVNQRHYMLNDTIRSHNEEYIKRLVKQEHVETDSYIIPLVQYGTVGLTDKEDFLMFLDSILPDDAQVHMSTGYFNPSSTISQLRISSILAPSEVANGFHDGRGALKYVPRIYSALYKHYIETHPNSKLFLYDRPNWSFHAKGIWVEELDNLYIHLIGSSNFNCRSSQRDFETQLVLLTRNKELIERLNGERVELWRGTKQVESCDIVGLNVIYHTLARLLKTFL